MLYWAKKVGKGYGSGAPSSPILVGEDLVYTTATSVVKINSILKEKMSTKIRNILFALIFICCVSIAGNIIQGFYLPGQSVAPSKNEELDIEALQKVWSESV